MNDVKMDMGSLYDMNRQLMSQIEPIDPNVLDQKYADVGAWFGSDRNHKNFMLLNRENHDYTVFRFEEPHYFNGVQELQAVLDGRGKVVAVDYNHDMEGYEFWVQIANDMPRMYCLFPCDDFIIVL